MFFLCFFFQAANCSFDDVVKTTLLLADMADFNRVNAVYREFFTKDRPARAAIQVATRLSNYGIWTKAVPILSMA
jgi:2-iminobutanoate/2-iminopropanoate deaminase